MVKKIKQAAKKTSPAAALLDNKLAGAVKDSAQQIWLAGLGAFSRAQAEGTKVFESLVKEGATVQKKTQAAAEEKFSEVTGKVSAIAEDAQARYNARIGQPIGETWGKLESIFEERTAKALSKLGVPSAKDVDALMKRIDDLSAQIATLSKAAKPAPKATTSAAANNGAAKPAAKRATKRAITNQTAA